MDTDNLQASWAEFCSLSENHEVVRELAGASQAKRFQAGQTVLEQGEAADTLLLITQGRLRAVRFTENGHEIWLSDLTENDLIGEMGLYAGGHRTATIIASETAAANIISTRDFQKIIEQHAAVGAALARQLAVRLAATSGHLAELMAMPVSTRLHAELVRLSEPDTVDSELWILRDLPTITELGGRIHASREATSRAVSVLEKRGILLRQKQVWQILVPRAWDIDVS